MNLDRPEASGGYGGLSCCSSCGYKESDMTEQLNTNSKVRETTLLYVEEASVAGPQLQDAAYVPTGTVCQCWKIGQKYALRKGYIV